jgi:hypothetical protein
VSLERARQVFGVALALAPNGIDYQVDACATAALRGAAAPAGV